MFGAETIVQDEVENVALWMSRLVYSLSDIKIFQSNHQIFDKSLRWTADMFVKIP